MEQFWAFVAYVQGLEDENVALERAVKRLEDENTILRTIRDQVIKDSLNPRNVFDLLELIQVAKS